MLSAACEGNRSEMDFEFNEAVESAANEQGLRDDAMSQGTFAVGKVSKEDLGSGSTGAAEPSTEMIDMSAQIDKAKIIRNGWITAEVEEYDQARESLGQLVESYGAFISRENEQRDEYRIKNDIEIKVHNSRFDEMMDAIAKTQGVAHIDERRTSSIDVGEEYYDLQSRLKTKREVEQR